MKMILGAKGNKYKETIVKQYIKLQREKEKNYWSWYIFLQDNVRKNGVSSVVLEFDLLSVVIKLFVISDFSDFGH